MTISALDLEPLEEELTRLADDDLERLLLIRHFENGLLDLFAAGKLNGTTHTCLGQEYIPVALRTLLAPDDFVFSNHRGHGHYLARFDDPFGLLAEIMGRAGAVCDGVGGSQHIFRDNYLSTGVQGESLPVAVGVGLHFRRAGEPRVAVTFIGDGTWGEGSVYEALNLAQLWRSPLVVVVENNGIAQTSPTELQMAGSIADRAAAFGARYRLIDSIDINEIRAQLAGPIAEVREHGGPLVIEFITHRIGPHSKGDDTRPADVIAWAKDNDWYLRYGGRYPEQFAAADARCRERVVDTIRAVEAQPPSSWET
jgi:TPP-dependent pyruvate/acetoin dehydrogenase alpha subunit